MKIKYNHLGKREALHKLFEILNALQPSPENRLTETEYKLLTEFLLLPKKKFEYQRFSTLARTKVQEITKEQNWQLSRENINNKIYSALDKGYLRRDEDSVIYLSKHIQALAFQLLAAFDDKKTPFSIQIEFEPPATDASSQVD